MQTSYTYDPFGNPSVSGAASGNRLQYTGLPNDGTGLQYNRARYYDPTLQRFISADPAGFGGGSLNLYSYVGNSPTNGTDPSGQMAQLVFGCAVGAAWGVGLVLDLAGRKADLNGYLRAAAAGCAVGTLIAGGVTAGLGLAAGAGLAASVGASAAAGDAESTAEGAGADASSQVQFDWNRAAHIFRNATGHVNPATNAEKEAYAKLFERVASNLENARPDFPLDPNAVRAGVKAFTEALDTGEQVWVYVRNGLIEDAGVNPPGEWR